MNIFDKIGKVALGSRLRLLTAQISDEAAQIYKLYNIENFSPKWFPVFFALSDGEEKTITEIATEIGHSQPSVTKIIKEMIKSALVKDNLKSKDKRRNVVGLTAKGNKLVYKIIKVQCGDIDAAIDGIISQSTHNLWEAIAEWEFLFEQKSLYKRVQEQKKLRESKHVKIVKYKAQYKSAFKVLNEEWISNYFKIEETDRKAIDNPEEYILQKGGEILVALYHNEPVGVCALIKMDDPKYEYELAKMAVSPKAQGKSIGWLLGEKAIETAKELGASCIYVESNTMLKPAINLYYKLGFNKIIGHATPYERCDIQMELTL